MISTPITNITSNTVKIPKPIPALNIPSIALQESRNITSIINTREIGNFFMRKIEF